jgi:hypothetical protein
LLRIRQRHRRRRGAQIENEWTGRTLRLGRFGGLASCRTRCMRRRWRHRNLLPRTDVRSGHPWAGRVLDGEVCASRLMRDRGSPAVIGTHPLDRWLCVPAFQRVCPCHFRVQVSKRRG